MAKLTADTITDEQIRNVFASRPDARMLWYDKVNLHETVEPYASIRRDARARCAEILNAHNACDGVVYRDERWHDCVLSTGHDGPHQFNARNGVKR